MRVRKRFLRSALAILAVVASPLYAAAPRNLPGFNTNTLPANDDGSTGLVPVGFTGNFFGTIFSSLYVNNNGNITFTAPLSTFTPFGLAGTSTQIIAPFFADVDTRGTGSGVVHYGTDTVNGHTAFGVEWPGVGYFGEHTDKLNTFEVVLIDRSDTGSGNFDIEFNYGSIRWETGDASGGVNGFGGSCARAGYSNGAGVTYELPGSAVCGALLDGGSNALVSAGPSMTRFQVRNGVISQTPSSITAQCAFAPAVLSAPGTTSTPATITVLTGATVMAQCGAYGGNPGYTWSFQNLPPWLNPSSLTGQTISLSGTAPAPPPGTYTIGVTVMDSTTPTPAQGTTTLTIIVIPPLMISCSPLNPTVSSGSTFSASCGATGGVGPYSWTYPSLPGWLTPSGNTGSNISLSGTVPGSPPNSYTVTVTLRDSMNQQVQQTISITVGKGGGGGPSLLLISCSPSSATVNPGTQFTASCSVTGGTAPYNIIPSGLPAWLSASISANSVSFAGTVPAPPPNSYSVGVVVADSSNPSRTQSQVIAITVNGGRLSVNCNPGTVSVAAGASFSVGCSVTGGTAPYSWSYSGFPGGASGPATGASVTIGGTMPAPPPSSYTGAVSVTDSTPGTRQSASTTVGLTNTTTVLSVSCSGPASAASGAAYSATCSATGGTAGYTWSFSLPSWLTASGSTGPTITLSGTMPSPPPSSYSITASVKDGGNPAQSATQTFSVANTTPVLQISCTPGPLGVNIGAAYSASCTASGGTPGYTWSYSGLPAWLSGGTSGASITLSGTAAAPTGPVSVVVTLTDTTVPTKQTTTQTITFTVNPPALQMSCTPATATVNAGTPFSTTCTATGGVPAYSWSFGGGGLPAWLTSSGTAGASITLSGAPPNPPPASYSFTVVVTDSTTPNKQTANQAIQITVQPGLPQGLTVSTNTTGVTANNANVVVMLGAAATSALTGTVQLTFKPDASVTNVPSGYDGASGVCETGTGFPSGALVSGPCNTIATVNLAAGSTTASIQFSVGTVAGVWTATLTSLNSGAVSVLPSPAPNPGVFTVAAGAPVISGVQLQNVTNSGFDVKVTGVSSRRDVASGMFTFSGTDLTGTTFTVPFSGADQTYFTSPAGLAAGGTFAFSLHFPYSGDPNALTGVAVTLTNSKGETSASVSGGK